KLRIIPACAGSTARLRRSGDPQWDHPRVRGEHVAVTRSRTFLNERSPGGMRQGPQQADAVRVGTRGQRRPFLVLIFQPTIVLTSFGRRRCGLGAWLVGWCSSLGY